MFSLLDHHYSPLVSQYPDSSNNLVQGIDRVHLHRASNASSSLQEFDNSTMSSSIQYQTGDSSFSNMPFARLSSMDDHSGLGMMENTLTKNIQKLNEGIQGFFC